MNCLASPTFCMMIGVSIESVSFTKIYKRSRRNSGPLKFLWVDFASYTIFHFTVFRQIWKNNAYMYLKIPRGE